MIREAVILAGGLGTRLRDTIGEIPKPMAPVNGSPFLEYQLRYLEKWGLSRIILSVGYKYNMIMDHFKDRFRDMELVYAIEEEPLGTGGGIKKAMSMVNGNSAFILNGDTYFDVNLKRLEDFQRIKDSDLTIILRFVDDVARYGAVEIDEEFLISGFYEKNEKTGPGYINGGVYLLNKRYFLGLDLPEKFSMEKDYFEKYYTTERIFALRCFSYFIDIGIPEDYQRACNEFKDFGY